MSPTPTVAELLGRLDATIPFEWAEDWDSVGLLVGDPAAEMGRILVSLDADLATVRRAIAMDASVLLTHHPAALELPLPLLAGGSSAAVYEALRAGLALIACHTNLDRAPEGADAIARAVGLEPDGPLEAATMETRMVTVWVPEVASAAVRGALADAGAGRIGGYSGCWFEASGTGSFTPRPGAEPAIGVRGEATQTPERRIEALCDPARLSAVLAAVRAAHPYEEPLITVTETRLSRGVARMGRICDVPADVDDLASLAAHVSAKLQVTPRVWGTPDAAIRRVAVAPGSGRSLITAALKAGADALVTGELRYHDALDARTVGLPVIEAGHDATEWPYVPILARVARAVDGLGPDSVVVDEPSVHWWTP